MRYTLENPPFDCVWLTGRLFIFLCSLRTNSCGVRTKKCRAIHETCSDLVHFVCKKWVGLFQRVPFVDRNQTSQDLR
jgi:hypothetical protein